MALVTLETFKSRHGIKLEDDALTAKLAEVQAELQRIVGIANEADIDESLADRMRTAIINITLIDIQGNPYLNSDSEQGSSSAYKDVLSERKKYLRYVRGVII